MSLSSKKPVLLLAKTGFIIRNLLLGTFADEIMKERPLVVAVPNPGDEKLTGIFKGSPVRFIPFPEEGERILDRAGKLKLPQTYMYHFRQAEKGNESLRIQTRLFSSKRSFQERLFNGSLVAAGHCLKTFGLMGIVEKKYLNAVARWELTKEWEKLLLAYAPAAVLSTMLTHSLMYYVSCDLPPVLAAHKHGLPVGTLVQSWDNLSSKTSVLPPWLEHYWTWSETMSEELVSMNPRVPRARVKAVGSPQFDFHLLPDLVEPRETYMKRQGMDPSKKYVLIGTGTEVWFPQEPAQTLAIVKSLRQKFPDLQILIRLHPKDDDRRWESRMPELKAAGVFFQKTAPRVHMDRGGFIPPRDFYKEQVNTLHHAAIVLNTASTLTVDAAILDRPVLCIAYDEVPDPRFPEGRCLAYSRSSHYSTLAATGGVKVIFNLRDCVDAVERYLADPSLDREGRARIVEKVTGKVDGGAGKRLAREVLAMARD